ncbi:hypothetical protein [Streptomyces sp. OR43]|uniref:hypothetical protein n=1 Tax=Streptomyces sp. or43 TaxID=2478957 RepID=UPI0011CD98F6|nr:hypothetical protein [Streptomyces sp. or43]TXS44942.1 hypothetical protein EAO72_07930 [Streptomyces sp. or43]
MAKPSDELIQLYRAAVEAQAEATSKPHSDEGWAPWREAAETFQRAVTEEAAGEDRAKLEMAVKKIVLHSEPAE